ncbi:hypothetical protein EDB92DRAFT_1944806 [Lactarius akahatsu]|uniref:Uncharacterized protein n=1 Tax=Lactarius akahatsu TaxID=416441 RepID=A0AAD4LIN4_9AGAM|nr:hypothetical protein EDB92DRAFT_1944806 [Lactarius akahatsu]
MTTTPIVSMLPHHPPSSIILENLTIPSQLEGIPVLPSNLLTPYSLVLTSPPLPVLALATEHMPPRAEMPPPPLKSASVPLTLILGEMFPMAPLSSVPEGTFPVTSGYFLTPLASSV